MNRKAVMFEDFQRLGEFYCEEICSHESGDCARCKVSTFTKHIDDNLRAVAEKRKRMDRSELCLLVLNIASSVFCIAALVLLIIRLAGGGF